MFVTCPSCKELIKKNVGPCPLCKHMVTADYILKYEKEERRQADEYNREKMAIFSKRRGVATLVTVILIVVVIVTMIVCGSMKNEPLGIGLVLAEIVIAVVVGHFTKCFNCPYCGKYYKSYASRGISFQTDCCPHCGGRLR